MTLLLSGCSAEVNLEIVDDKINESTVITAYENAIYSKEILRTSFRNYIPAFARDVIVDTMPDEEFPDVKYYEKSETDSGNFHFVSADPEYHFSVRLIIHLHCFCLFADFELSACPVCAVL